MARKGKMRIKELYEALRNAPDVGVKKDLMELLELLYADKCEDLISNGSDLIRGNAQMLRTIKEKLDKRIDSLTDAP